MIVLAGSLFIASGSLLIPSDASAGQTRAVDISRGISPSLWAAVFRSPKGVLLSCRLAKGRRALCAVASARGIRNLSLARRAADARARGLLARRLGSSSERRAFAPDGGRLRTVITEAVLRATTIRGHHVDRAGRTWSLAVLDPRAFGAALLR